MKYIYLMVVPFLLSCGASKHTEEFLLPPVPVMHMSRSGACATIILAKDTNYNGTWDASDSEQQASSICDGVAGTSGASAYDLAVSSGYVGSMSDWLASLVGPRGLDGTDGRDGVDGSDGADGTDGAPGATGPIGPMPVLPAGNIYTHKLCSGDTSTHPEYGFIVGPDIYAVYYGVIAGVQQAFFTKLNNGTYVTTNGAACTFTVSHNSSGDLLIDGVVIAAHSSGLSISQSAPSNGTHSYKIVLKVKNNSSYTTGAWRVEFTAPAATSNISCSVSGSHIQSNVGLQYTLSSQSHTFYMIAPGTESGDITCQVNLPHKAGGYLTSEQVFTNLKVIQL